MKDILLLTNDNKFAKLLKAHINFNLHSVKQFKDAAEVLKMQSVKLAILDRKNKENKQLLDFLKETYPQIIRLSLLDDGNNACIVQMNDYRSAQISWQKQHGIDEIAGVIGKLIALVDRVNDADMLNMVSNLKQLPTIPKIYFELTKLIDKNAAVGDISKILEEDQAVSTNVLKMANSAFYNAKTGSIHQAVMYIGLTNVKNIVLTNAVFDSDMLEERFRVKNWQHVSFANKLLHAFYQNVLNKKLNTNISSVGLLYDIGNIVLMCNFPKLIHDLLAESKAKDDEEMILLEKKDVGISHEEIGGHLLDLWRLPFPVVEAALYHHDPLSPNVINKELVMILHIADYYSWRYVGVPVDKLVLEEGVFDALGIPHKVFEDYYHSFIKELTSFL